MILIWRNLTYHSVGARPLLQNGGVLQWSKVQQWLHPKDLLAFHTCPSQWRPPAENKANRCSHRHLELETVESFRPGTVGCARVRYHCRCLSWTLSISDIVQYDMRFSYVVNDSIDPVLRVWKVHRVRLSCQQGISATTG